MDGAPKREAGQSAAADDPPYKMKCNFYLEVGSVFGADILHQKNIPLLTPRH
jgi:hypothetical protein